MDNRPGEALIAQQTLNAGPRHAIDSLHTRRGRALVLCVSRARFLDMAFPTPVLTGTLWYFGIVLSLILGTVACGVFGVCRKDNVKIAAVIYTTGGVCAWLLW